MIFLSFVLLLFYYYTVVALLEGNFSRICSSLLWT